MSAQATRDSDTGSTVAVWLVSLTIHGMLLLLVATSSGTWFGTPGIDDGAGGATLDDGEDFRSVGVVVKPKENEPAEDPADADPADQPGDGPASAIDGPVVPDEAPVAIDLPTANDRAIGAGHLAPPSRAPADVGDAVRPGGAFDRVPVGGLKPGETRFFGIRDKGQRIVYLIDISGSMGGPKLAAAKSQVLVSLESLSEKQQFQVVFFHTVQMPMTLKVADVQQRSLFDKSGVYIARAINKTLTRQYLGSVVPDSGTNSEPALLKALDYQPDVLYFLTDDDSSQLGPVPRGRIRKQNETETRIHCIEFGDGLAPTGHTPLKKLASENNGLYRYIPVGQLR